MIHATFIMEQHLGHQTLYQNLRRFIDGDSRVCATWVPVTYTGDDGFWESLPFLSTRIRGSLTGRQQVQNGLKIKPCDILYFNTQVPAVLHYPQAFGRPYIVATDITPVQYDEMAAPYGHRPDQVGPVRTIKHSANARVLRGAARLLPWSAWAADSLINDYGVNPTRVEVIPVGVDLEWWRSTQHAPNQLPRILFVGGDFVRKGGNYLLKAYQSLPKGSAELVIVTHSYVPPEEGVRIYENIQPNSEELRGLYQACDIFVLPSTAEAFGISAVEASAMGLPVIATSTGGLSTIIADQITGFLIAVGEIASLATRLRLLIENFELRQQMGQAGIERAHFLFDAKKNAARLVDLMVEIASVVQRK